MPSLPSTSHLEKRLYGCGYYNNYCNDGGGLSYGGRVGIGIGIAVAVLLLVLALGFAARKRRMAAMSSTRPVYNTTQQPAYQQQAYMPQTGYGYPSTNNQYTAGSGYPAQGGNANTTSYPPPAGPPPTDQPEMVDGQAYAPPSAPPPSYQK